MVKSEQSNTVWSLFPDMLNQLHSQFQSWGDGKVANDIPELAEVNPNLFSICIAITDGQIYEVGDSEQLFTIQSISKVFVYGLALEDHAQDEVLKDHYSVIRKNHQDY